MCSTPSCSSAPADLGLMAAVDLAGLGRAEIVRPAVGVEAHRQAMRLKHLLQRPEGRGRALLLDQEGRGRSHTVASSIVTIRLKTNGAPSWLYRALVAFRKGMRRNSRPRSWCRTPGRRTSTCLPSWPAPCRR